MELDLRKYNDEEAYFLKFGAIPINIFPKSKNEKPLPIHDYLKKLENAFDDSKNLKNWKKIKENDEIAEDTCTISNPKNKIMCNYFFNYLYHLRFNIPKNLLKKEFFALLEDEKKLELNNIFDILYDGFSYVSFKKINLNNLFFIGGIAIREEFEKTIRKAGNLVHCAPNPIREEFILIKTNKPLPKNINYFEFYKDYFRIFCFIPKEKDISHFDFIKYVFSINKESLKIFYEVNLTQELLELGGSSILELKSLAFEKITKNKKIKSKELENICSQIYLHMNRFLENKMDFENEKKRFFDEFKENSFLTSNQESYEKELSISEIDFASINQQMEYINKIIDRKNKLKQWIVTISLSIITSILTLLIGLKLFS